MNELEKLYTGIVLRGTSVELHSDVGQKFLTALCRESEGIITSEDLRLDWGLSDEDVDNLGSNEALISALRAELEPAIAGRLKPVGAPDHPFRGLCCFSAASASFSINTAT